MILGIGNDIVDITRVERLLALHGERFITRCFTAVERETAEGRRKAGTHAMTYAKRFSAKEACVKALGTGFREGIYMTDIEVANDDRGRPALVLTGGAEQRLASMVPAGMKAILHLSLSDEPPVASAFVVIEAVPCEKL